MDRDEYDVEYPKHIGILGARLHIGHSRDSGEVTAFFVQLEYQLENDSAAGEAGEWVEVVRSDHHSTSAGGHDVRCEGVHLDVYRDGEKDHTEQLTGPIPQVDVAFDVAEEQITDDAEQYINRFKQWHRNRNPNRDQRDGFGRRNGPSES
ncbi:MAG TPA: hypothetical protein VFJ06_14240 [Halococcus sp.]|nr:hypothetical protein [Halococcus sp.]